jgi:8-oxo-dGTP diphosphatase
MRTEKTARAIIISNAHLLTLKPEGKDIFFTPGGRIESGETPEEALMREMSEELPNVVFEHGFHLGVIEHCWRETSGEEIVGIHHFFRIYTPSLSAPVIPRSVESGLAFVWIHVDELPVYPLQPPSLTVLVPRLLAGSKIFWATRDVDS